MTVREREITIDMGEGSASAFLYADAQPGARKPGVLFLTDIGGVRKALREAAHRLAERGHTVLLPNLFHRVGEPPFFTPPLDMRSPEVRAIFGKLFGSVPPAKMEADGGRYVDFLAAQAETAPGAISVVGHCFSGAMALYTAAARPERVGAAASFHGGRLVTDGPDSPHRLLPRIKARLYFGHAVQDTSMTQEAIDKLGAALAAWGGRHENELYDGALHGWTTRDSRVYHEAQAERAFSKLVELIAAA